MPTKPLAGFTTLSDIQSGGGYKKGQFVDLLVAIAAVGPIKKVKTREGTEHQVRNFTVFDHTSAKMRISSWDQEFMTKIGLWKPHRTILFMTDMRIQFCNSFVATITSRPIITEDPEGPEVQAIRNNAQTAALEAIELLDKLIDYVVLNGDFCIHFKVYTF